MVPCFRIALGANNLRYRIWYELKNSAFQYDQCMANICFWLTVSYPQWFRVYFKKLIFTALAVNTRWITIFWGKIRDLIPWPSNIERQCAKLHKKIVPFIKQVYMNKSSQIPNVIDRCCSVSTRLLCFRCKEKSTRWMVKV